MSGGASTVAYRADRLGMAERTTSKRAVCIRGTAKAAVPEIQALRQAAASMLSPQQSSVSG
jgi:hypothetical protein